MLVRLRPNAPQCGGRALGLSAPCTRSVAAVVLPTHRRPPGLRTATRSPLRATRRPLSLNKVWVGEARTRLRRHCQGDDVHYQALVAHSGLLRCSCDAILTRKFAGNKASLDVFKALLPKVLNSSQYKSPAREEEAPGFQKNDRRLGGGVPLVSRNRLGGGVSASIVVI